MLRRLAVPLLVALCALGFSQDRLETMPRYDRYTRMTREMFGSVVGGGVQTTWSEDSKEFTYSYNQKIWKYVLADKRPVETNQELPQPQGQQGRGRRRGGGGAPARGRQFSIVDSPDKKLKAETRDRNVYISDSDGKNEIAVTTEGSVASRIKYGVASWVYGEELEVRNAMWWSPDSKKLAYYRFDESQVKDYYISMDEREIQDRLDTEAYPKAGAPNPKVELYIYDLGSKMTTKVDVGFEDASLSEYVYDVRWSDDGKNLFFNRTNRKQNKMQFCAADPDTGTAHSIVEESQPQSWAENHPEVRFLADNNRFIWSSERNGYRNYYLYDLSGKLLTTLTSGLVDATSIARLDEKARRLFYVSSGSKNPYFRQLHRVGLDGKGDVTITSEDLDHDVTIAPDGKHFTDIAQSCEHPAETRLLDASGKILNVFSTSDTTKFDALGLKKTEMFTYLAADGKTQLYGTLQFPSDFDPNKKYPVLLGVYAGPESGGINARFSTPSPLTELGFIVANLAGRGTMGRGKAFRDAVYGKLGIVEIDDQDAGIKSLGSRPYVDLKHVGVYGTSYGGYTTVMCVLRHPETFAVGCASSSVTDWRNYDSIYTERYMGLPEDGENKAGYENGSAMKYASRLTGKLMLYFGSADNNVHPSNTYQLVQALDGAGKQYDMQVGPDREHTQMNSNRMWAYFVNYLVLKANPTPLNTVWNSRAYRKAKARKAAVG